MKRAHEKHMLKAEESYQIVSFASVSQEGTTREVPAKLSAQKILSVTFLSFIITLYTLITHKNCEEAIQREKPQIDFLQHTHTHLLKRELLILSDEIILASSPSLSHCHTLRGDLYPNITHTFSECRKCFRAWKVLGICQKKPMRLRGCNQAYYGIRRAREDKALLSQLVAGAWRLGLEGLLLFVYSNFILQWINLPLRGWRRDFLPSSSISSSITRLGVILWLHLSSLTLVLYFYCLLFMFMHQSSYRFVAFHLLLFRIQISQSKSNLTVILIGGQNKLLCFHTISSFQQQANINRQTS